MLSATQPLSEKLPAHGCRHVAIIMDGNGRWAKKQGKIRAFGHKAGAKSVRRAVSFAANNGIEALTLYAFSSENWNRPAQEVSALMELFVWALDSEVKSLHRHNVRLRIFSWLPATREMTSFCLNRSLLLSLHRNRTSLKRCCASLQA